MVKKRIIKTIRKVKRFAKIDSLAFALAVGILSALCMLICGIIGSFGYWPNFNEFVAEFYVGYTPFSILGVLFGAVYAFLDGFIGGYIIAWLYNKFGR